MCTRARTHSACSYEQDGFTHLTADPALLLTVANHFYTSSQVPGRRTGRAAGENGGQLVTLGQQLRVRGPGLVGRVRLTTHAALFPSKPTSLPQGDWEVLVLDSSRLTAEVKYEPAAPVGNTSSGGLLGGGAQQEQQAEQPQEPLFPHLYGALDLTAVVRRVPMQRAEDGSFTGIAGLV